MKINISCLRVAILLTLIVIFWFSWAPQVESSPSPKRRGVGGTRRYGGGSSSSSSRSNCSGRRSKNSDGYRSKSSKKCFLKKHWKKAAAFGAGAYVGHKVSKKVCTKF